MQIVEDSSTCRAIISGKLRLDFGPVRSDLPAVVQHALDAVPCARRRKRKGRDRDYTGPRAEIVSGDRIAFNRFFGISFPMLSSSPTAGGVVEVRLARVNVHVEVDRQRHWPGIPAGFLPHVFERFRQADAGITRGHGGLGLGLAIMRHLVELHGGLIFAASDGPGTGSTFRIEMPVSSGSQVEGSDTSRAPRAAPRLVMPRLQGIRVVAVDDDRDALALVQEILEGRRCR